KGIEMRAAVWWALLAAAMLQLTACDRGFSDGGVDVSHPSKVSEDEAMQKQPEVSDYTWSHGGVIRGPRDRKAVALVFTGHDFGDGLGEVLETLAEHEVPGSFFFTGDFYRNPKFHADIRRAVQDGHYMGAHSDKHLLYAPWEDRNKT